MSNATETPQLQQAGQGYTLRLRDIVEASWRALPAGVLAGLFGLLLGLALIFFLRAGLPSLQISRAAVHFVFDSFQDNNSSEQGRFERTYPNGSPFSIKDLTTPAVIQAVYDKNDLQKFGIDSSTFSASVSVRSWSPLYQDVVERYRTRLANKKLTFAESTAIERAMEAELTALNSQNALVELVLASRFGLPEAVARKVVADIPVAWADHFVKKLGVTKLPQGTGTVPLIDKAMVPKQEFPITVDLLQSNTEALRRRLVELETIAGGETVIDEKTGQGVRSLIQAVADINDFRLPALVGGIVSRSAIRDQGRVATYFDQRFALLDAEKKRLDARFKAERDTVDAYFKEKAPPPMPTTEAAKTGEVAPGAVTQVSDSIVNLVMRLSREGLDLDFRRKHTAKQLRQLEPISQAERERSQVEGLKAVFAKVASAGDGAKAGALDEELVKEATAVIETLNAHWSTLTRLYDVLSARNFSYGSQLSVPLLIGQSEQYAVSHPVFNAESYKVVAAIALSALLGVWALAIAWILLLRYLRATR